MTFDDARSPTFEEVLGQMRLSYAVGRGGIESPVPLTKREQAAENLGLWHRMLMTPPAVDGRTTGNEA